MTINEFIKQRPHLVWYTRNYDGLSKEAIVEAVLNYGDWDDIQKLLKIIGIKKTARIFEKQINRRRCNYNDKVKNYFKLYFSRYA